MVDVYWKSDQKANSHQGHPGVRMMRAPKQPSCVKLPCIGQKRFKIAKNSTLKDLCPEDKVKVKQLIEDLAKVGSDKERLEALHTEERRRFRELLAAVREEYKRTAEEKQQLAKELLSSQQQLQLLLQSSSDPSCVPPQGQDVVPTSDVQLEVGWACSTSSDVVRHTNEVTDCTLDLEPVISHWHAGADFEHSNLVQNWTCQVQQRVGHPSDQGGIGSDVGASHHPLDQGGIGSDVGVSHHSTDQGDIGTIASNLHNSEGELLSSDIKSVTGVETMLSETFRVQVKTQKPCNKIAGHLISEIRGLPPSESKRPVVEVQRPVIEVQRPVIEVQRPVIEVQRVPLTSVVSDLPHTEIGRSLLIPQRPSIGFNALPGKTLNQPSHFHENPACLLRRQFNSHLSMADEPARSSQVASSCGVYQEVPSFLSGGPSVEVRAASTKEIQRGNDGRTSSPPHSSAGWTALPLASPVPWDCGEMQQMSWPVHNLWTSPPKTQSRPIVEPCSKAQSFPSTHLPGGDQLHPGTQFSSKAEPVANIQSPTRAQHSPNNEHPFQRCTMHTRNVTSLSPYKEVKLSSNDGLSFLVSQGPASKAMKETSTQTVSTESASTQTRPSSSLSTSPSILSKDVEVQTIAEQQSHEITREDEEEKKVGKEKEEFEEEEEEKEEEEQEKMEEDKSSILTVCCNNGTYKCCEDPPSGAASCSAVHTGCCSAVKSVGSLPALHDTGTPITSSWLCSEPRLEAMHHFDCHMESLIASTLLNDPEPASTLVQSIGSHCNSNQHGAQSIGSHCNSNQHGAQSIGSHCNSNQHGAQSIDSHCNRRESRKGHDGDGGRPLTDPCATLDQSELDLLFYGIGSNCLNERPLSPSDLAVSMIRTELKKSHKCSSKAYLKKQTSGKENRLHCYRTTEAVENNILKDLFFV